MDPGIYQKIIDSLSQDNEEKLFQLSRLRLVAETMAHDLQSDEYFTRICEEFNSIFETSLTCILWRRLRDPGGWWLEAFDSKDGCPAPSKNLFSDEDAGVLLETLEKKTSLFLENVDPSTISCFCDHPDSGTINLVLFPLILEKRQGILLLLNPHFRMKRDTIQHHIEILHSLIQAGISNRLYYKTLNDTAEEFRDLIDNSSDIVIVTYPDGIIRDYNTEFVKKLELETDPKTQKLQDLISDDQGQLFQNCWQDLLSGKEVSQITVNLKRRDGSILETELSGNARFNADGSVNLIRLYIRDITDRRAAEKKQRELEYKIELERQRQLAQIGLYTTGIAHNLQNPLQVLVGYITVLKNKGTEIPGLSIIERSANSIMEIVRSLMVKMSRDRLTDEIEIDISDLLKNEITFLNANQFFKYEVEKKIELSTNLPTIKGVYSDFSQAIMNIIYNALDAIMESERKELLIRSSFDEEQNAIHVEIADSGPGIPAEIQQNIFTPFYTTKQKNSNASHEIASGSGLGLSSSMALLEPYGGIIEFSTEEGKGTIFTIRIPLNRGNHE